MSASQGTRYVSCSLLGPSWQAHNITFIVSFVDGLGERRKLIARPQGGQALFSASSSHFFCKFGQGRLKVKHSKLSSQCEVLPSFRRMSNMTWSQEYTLEGTFMAEAFLCKFQ